jgi:hypothetical protein
MPASRRRILQATRPEPATHNSRNRSRSRSRSRSRQWAPPWREPQQPEAAGQSAIEALKQDHRRVEGLFSEFESATEDKRKQELVAMICAELNIHTRLEEEIFYRPAARRWMTKTSWTRRKSSTMRPSS